MDGSKDPDDVPEIFFLIVNFFDQNPSVYSYEGIFHVNCSDERLYELEVHLGMKNYYIMDEMVETPQVVANYLKRMLQNMKEPLVPFKSYSDFSDLANPQQDSSSARETLFSTDPHEMPVN